jgi:hypothetical protein
MTPIGANRVLTRSLLRSVRGARTENCSSEKKTKDLGGNFIFEVALFLRINNDWGGDSRPCASLLLPRGGPTRMSPLGCPKWKVGFHRSLAGYLAAHLVGHCFPIPHSHFHSTSLCFHCTLLECIGDTASPFEEMFHEWRQRVLIPKYKFELTPLKDPHLDHEMCKGRTAPARIV